MMTRNRLDELLDRIAKTRVAVLGDFCLDAYWIIDRALAETSLETHKQTMPVREQYYSLGGAGNIVANLADLGVARVFAIGVIGHDLFGEEMVRKLKALKADTTGMIVQKDKWATPVYGKPYAGEEELNRVDFGVYNELTPETEVELEKNFCAVLNQVDAVILNQQLPRGIASDNMIKTINRVVSDHPNTVFVCDSRNRSEKFRSVCCRLNAHEAARLCGHEQPLDQGVLLDDAVRFAGDIFRQSGKPVFISRGDRGSIVCWKDATKVVPGIQTLRKTDTVGAGDTSVSAITGALAAGATSFEAAILANFASAVTVQKLKTTGTATPAEIRQVGYDPDYVFRPELAGDPRAARYIEETEIEIVTDDWPRGKIRHALFDHDGTVSTLRQGWEPIMEEFFIRTILGPAYETADETVYRRIASRVKDYVVKSTGIQTLSQMASLVEMIREFGFVPAEQVVDPLACKRLYVRNLMEKVNQRIAKLKRGELEINDFTVKGAVEFLKMLKARGVRLYLASGTDDADVKAEAAALGYAGLFDGGIYGASDDVKYDAKREVIERILTANKLSGAELACFGDGPVELREGKKRGGITIGIASDEVRRYGLNLEKRARLICAGADLIAPDFTHGKALVQCLFG